MWPEIEQAKNEKRRELVLHGSKISKRIKEEGLDNTLYSLIDLNYLSLTETCLQEISSDFSLLVNLQTLILHSNNLEIFEEALTKLSKLKILDASRNNLKALPDTLDRLSQITTLNFSGNKLESFPSLMSVTKLSVLDLSFNNLSNFPGICHTSLANLSEIKLQGNHIESIPNTISDLPALKMLDLSVNKIQSLPGELADCHKLKDLNLKSNPISDRRLFKLIEQCRTKQIIDYIKQNCPRTTNRGNASEKKDKKGAKDQNGDSENNQDIENDVSYKYSIIVKQANENFKVIVDSSTKSVREFIICCLINNVSFTEDSFKEFIKIQNKLHDGICEKRNTGTIATHDFKKLNSSIIKYTTFPPSELKIKPLNRPVEMTGIELFTKLQMEANKLKKEKKRKTYSGIYKYLYLVEGQPAFPCLVNEKGEVISLPPITNADITKVDLCTTHVFVEITSSTSLNVCKTILTELLRETVNALGKDIEVQQVKIFDDTQKMKVVFPSKMDLKFSNNVPINVIRV
ncbi:leucine-rich repeat-containing protein 47-like [Anthonomus grandis grandis]|uniref:leucine-rich repeat-containing protein 47-like n=1 Tax=Anthonomus grandis grandis TaxID=2921223 RepID=UPI0021656289|nr:leucine-rich repeat-containing protein 47-like [Anthonomus grandis grandis]